MPEGKNFDATGFRVDLVIEVVAGSA